MKTKKHLLWLNQAKNDLQWAKHSLNGGYYSQVCFIAQQVGEKSLKALAYFNGADMVKGHSIVIVARELKINGEIEKAGRSLDLYYMASRYPDALPDPIAPVDYFTQNEAEEAIVHAELILKKVSDLVL